MLLRCLCLSCNRLYRLWSFYSVRIEALAQQDREFSPQRELPFLARFQLPELGPSRYFTSCIFGKRRIIDIINSFVDITNSFEELFKSITDMYEPIRIGEVSKSIGDIYNSIVDINNSFREVSNSFGELSNSIVDINNSFEELNKWSDLESSLNVFLRSPNELLISTIHLESSLIQLLISTIHLETSKIQLLISTIELESSPIICRGH